MPASTWILDSDFDDLAIWRTIWEQHHHLICRIAHPERPVELEDGQGGWQAGTLAQAHKQMALVEIGLLDTKLDPWLLLTDWEVRTEA